MDINLLNIKDERIIKFLTENDFDNSFSIFKKAYYNFARPVMPLFIRHWLQDRVSRKVELKENFIWDELANIVKNKIADLELYPNNKDAAVILTHDVDTEEGFDNIPNILKIEEELGFKSSWNIVPYKYSIDQGIIDLINKSGHEIGIHGYNHDGKLFYSEKEFSKRVPKINKAIKKYGAKGFRAPMVHRNLEWLQKLDIEYDASCFDYDPFQPFPGGTGSIWPFKAGKFIELPYTLPQDHDLFFMMKRNDIDIWKKKTDWLIENKGIILLITHPDYLTGKYSELYREYLEFLKEKKDLWFALPKELSEHWSRIF
ncbi:MAG: polysaccharide deacetylase family protein [Candidatus Delongbacteria bacterium]|jgi:peptidoglycan/xylan/chitin deacetylase (PgdA/CDA1 family)|nr:polysaccharide deacetylase family protein [Candidatus Delongbacteria bacterium]